MVWYSHIFKNFQQFVMVHTVKGFGVINKAEVDVFMCFKVLQAKLQQYVNFQTFTLDLEKAEEPEIKLPTSVGS